MSALSIFDLTGRIALVTGGGTGIGYMIAQGLAANGANVYTSGQREHVLVKAAQEYRVNLSRTSSPSSSSTLFPIAILAARNTIGAAAGRLDILVNNAGQSGPRSTWMSDASTLQDGNASASQDGDAEALGLGLLRRSKEGNWATLFVIYTFALFVTTASIGLLAKGSERHGRYSASVINVTSMSGSLKLARSYVSVR
ncbi:hypothetical protein EV714DRAFT_211527 [Schizophyllum commune]